MTKIYVGNIAFGTQEEDLKDLFGAKGEVLSVKIITDRDSGRSKGFGFVEMSSDDAAQSAINDLNGQEFQGRNLKVNEAMDRPPKRDSRGGGGGYGGGGGGRGRSGGGGGGGWNR